MIDQTIPFRTLTDGMVRCLNEWILPHLTDPMARTQAQTLAALIDGLPDAWACEAGAHIREDSARAREVLAEIGTPVAGDPLPAGASIDALMEENAELKQKMREAAETHRASGDGAKLGALQKFFVESARREAGGGGQATDFAAMAQSDADARKD